MGKLFSSLCNRQELAIISTNQNQISRTLANDTTNTHGAPWALEPAQLCEGNLETQQSKALAKICLQKLSTCPGLDV